MAFHSIYLIFATSAICFFSCNKVVKPLPDPVKQYANERLGVDHMTEYNETKEYVVLSKHRKIKPSDPFPTLQFEVLEVKSMEVIFKDNIRGGKIFWKNDHILRVEGMKGIPGPEGQVPKAKKYHYDVQKRSKVILRVYK